MKKIKYFLLMVIALGLFANNADAQTKKKKKKTTVTAADKKNARRETKDSEENFWRTKMWYGADITFPSFGGGTFNMGVNPMAAYKINNRLSAGLLAKLDYWWVRVYPNPQLGITRYDDSFEKLDFGGGVFMRAKLFSGLFAHFEYERTRFRNAFQDADGYPIFDLNKEPAKVYTEKSTLASSFLGLGWASGGDTWKTQLGIYRNLLYKTGISRGEWDFRFGISYNF